MINFREIRIRNGRVFKHVDLPLDKQGVVSLLGRNGVGKSTIWGLLEAAIFSSTPGGEKRDQLLQAQGDASIEVDIEKNDIRYTVSYKRRKNKWSHSIFQEGVEYDLSSHSAIEAAKDARKLIGLTQEEFEGSVHLTQNSQHILISGKPSDRKNYIAEFFGIDSRFDAVKDKAQARLEKIRESITGMGALEQTRLALETEVAAIDLHGLPTLREHNKRVAIQLNTEKERLQEKIRDKQQWETYLEILPKIQRVENPEEAFENCLHEIATLQEKLRNLDATEKRWTANEQNRTIAINIATQLEQLRDQGIEDPDMQSIEIEIHKAETELATHHKLQGMYIEYQALQGLPEPVLVEDLEKERNRLQVAARVIEQRINALQEGKCPTCGSEYQKEHYEQDRWKLETLNTEIEALDIEIGKGKELNVRISRSRQLAEVLGDYTPLTAEEAESRKDLLRKAPLLRRYVELSQQLLKLPKVEDLPPPQNRETIEQALDIQFAQRKMLQGIIEIKAQLVVPKSPAAPTAEEIEKLQSLIAELEAAHLEMLKKIGSLEHEEKRLERLQKQLQELTTELSKLPELKKEEYLWSKMVEAYGPKGLRVQQLQKILALVMDRLPFYTSILFTDRDIRFYSECDAGNIRLLVKRTIDGADGRETISYDVASMSGGEKKRLSIALVLTLADCISNSKRSNILILDEIDANLDSEGQHLFVTELLPLLKEQYSSIFVISHAEEIKQAAVFDKVYRVKKEEGWSTLALEGA